MRRVEKLGSQRGAGVGRAVMSPVVVVFWLLGGWGVRRGDLVGAWGKVKERSRGRDMVGVCL